ncbi:MAG: methylenetetrahydrofolate reductase [NAD(P)H] [Kiritimatiellae bacterium]|nr:methylenetetrahydrofolate reductase [NAD(P)H] [Kiritimatiellia bacterium]
MHRPEIPIIDLIRNPEHPLLSLEFFPPKDEKGMGQLKKVAQQLLVTHPNFVTCTWGAGGSTHRRTLTVCEMLQTIGFPPIMPHLTCVGESRLALGNIAAEIYNHGFRNIMTLRGDPPRGESTFVMHPNGFKYASELVLFLKNRYPDVCCGVAGYPEAHPESESVEEDIRHLKEKVEAGASFITTQLFFDNALYFSFVDRCRNKGIDVPIIPGLLPAISLKQVERFTNMCGALFPEKLAANMRKVGGEGEAAQQVGIKWCADQINELLDSGVPGIHLYVLNRSNAALAPAVMDCFSRKRPLGIIS